MKIVLVESGEVTAVYHDFHKNKLCTYKTADGLEGLMEALGVRVTKHINCPNPKDGRLIADDGFPYHLDNLPDNKTTKRVAPKQEEKPKPVKKKTTRKKVTEKKQDEPQKAGRKARRPPKRKS